MREYITQKQTTTTEIMADSVVKGKNIDASKLTFSAPKVLDNGAKLYIYEL